MTNDLREYFNNKSEINGPKAAYVPMVIEDTPNGRVSQDIFSRLLKERIILLDGPVDDSVAAVVKAQMQFLENDDSSKDIHFYINSPGGVVTAGLAIFDVMKNSKCDVATYGIGQNCSMGSFLLAAGTKGKRYVLPSTRVMTHQPSGGAQGQQTDINIQANEINRMRNELETYYMHFMGMDTETPPRETEYGQGLFERDTFFNALAAVKLGHVDKVIEPKNKNEQDFFKLQMRLMEQEIESDPKISALIKIREDYLASKKPANNNAPAKPKKP
jgi:ATP-dependent Clp protease protease subunit